jgi:hypothetical protein
MTGPGTPGPHLRRSQQNFVGQPTCPEGDDTRMSLRARRPSEPGIMFFYPKALWHTGCSQSL